MTRDFKLNYMEWERLIELQEWICKTRPRLPKTQSLRRESLNDLNTAIEMVIDTFMEDLYNEETETSH